MKLRTMEKLAKISYGERKINPQSFIGITDEWQSGVITGVWCTRCFLCLYCRNCWGIGDIFQFLCREVTCISYWFQLWFERCVNGSQAVPVHAGKERVLLYFISSMTADTLVCRGDQAVWNVNKLCQVIKLYSIPSNQVLGLIWELYFLRKIESFRPVDNFAVRFMCIFGTKWWPTHQTFVHNCSQAPPVTFLPIPLMNEYLRSDIIRCSYCWVRLDATRLAPGVDLFSVWNC